MNSASEPSPSSASVRGLPLPGLLARLLTAGQWEHPGDETLHRVIPWFEDLVDFLTSTEHMERVTQVLDMFSTYRQDSQFFHVVRGSVAGVTELPWLDAESALIIARNRAAGDDVAIALDYRGDAGSPAVVASDVWTDPGTYLWRSVAPNFAAFAAALGIEASGLCF
jgi:hypothetical protein